MPRKVRHSLQECGHSLKLWDRTDAGLGRQASDGRRTCYQSSLLDDKHLQAIALQNARSTLGGRRRTLSERVRFARCERGERETFQPPTSWHVPFHEAIADCERNPARPLQVGNGRCAAGHHAECLYFLWHNVHSRPRQRWLTLSSSVCCSQCG